MQEQMFPIPIPQKVMKVLWEVGLYDCVITLLFSLMDWQGTSTKWSMNQKSQILPVKRPETRFTFTPW